MCGKRFIIGIGGATNSGKTTISSNLCKVLPHADLMRQDDYFLEPGDPHVEVKDGYQNWDTLSALDMDRMVRDVEQWIRQKQTGTETAVLIIEGFLIFNYSKLAALMNKKYFIVITKEVSEERRRHRTYNPPDTPGYFDNIVWPSYLTHLDALKNQDDIEYIDGLADLETVGEIILNKIMAALQNKPANGVV